VVLLVSSLGTDLHFKTAGRAPASATLLALAGSRLVPALWGALDGVALFSPLTEADVAEVLRRRAVASSARLSQTRGVRFEVERAVWERLAAASVADRMRGAVSAVDAFKHDVEDALAAFMLASSPREGTTLRVALNRTGAVIVTAG
jgi:ATP-dependent Clp protease ATP-binding subunit ClpC